MHHPLLNIKWQNLLKLQKMIFFWNVCVFSFNDQFWLAWIFWIKAGEIFSDEEIYKGKVKIFKRISQL